MAVKLKNVVEDMKAMIAAGDRHSPAERSSKILQLAGDFLTAALAGQAHNGRTAILMVDADGSHLSFAFPQHLARGNVMPIDHKSFAGRVVLKKAVLVENSVPDEPHKDFFERIPDPAGRVLAIEKLVASPLFGRDGKVIGVVEVSRAGSESAGAEANFTSRDAVNLEKSCRVFAPFIEATWARRPGW